MSLLISNCIKKRAEREKVRREGVVAYEVVKTNHHDGGESRQGFDDVVLDQETSNREAPSITVECLLPIELRSLDYM